MIKLIGLHSLVLPCVLFFGILVASTALAAKEAKPDLSVDCSKGKTVQEQVDAAIPGDVIQVSGICNENVLIMTSGVTLDGGGTAQIVGLGGPFLTGTVEVSGATNVTIRSFAMISGGSVGVAVTNSGHAIIGGEAVADGNTITANAFVGVFVALSSSATIENNAITSNGLPSSGGSGGILLSGTTSAVIMSNVIEDNGQNGVAIVSNSDEKWSLKFEQWTKV